MKKYFELIGGVLFTHKAAIEKAGVSWNYYRTKRSEGYSKYKYMLHPDNKKVLMVGFESMADEHKNKLKAEFGNPYDMVARQPILEMVVHHPEHRQWYLNYTYNGGTRLPLETVNKYSRAADWLEMLKAPQQDRAFIKKTMNLTIPQFYEHVAALLSMEKANGKLADYAGHDVLPADFPSSYQRLMAKVEKWLTDGVACMIDPAFGNKSAAKIGKSDTGYNAEIERMQHAFLRKAASDPRNLNASQVADLCNAIFTRKGWNTITAERVKQLLREWGYLTEAGRRGKRSYNNKVAMQHKRKAPSYPLYYLTLDGWTAELAFYEQGELGRMVIVVVLDTCIKYPIGFAIGDRENTALISEALRNAMQHIKDVLGDYYQPHQIQSDRYGIKTMTPLYQAMAHLVTPAAVGNAKAKVVEPYFKHLNNTYCQLLPNWTGHNIDAAKDNQPNREWMDLIKHSYPNKAGVVKLLEYIMNKERSDKLADYLALWQVCPRKVVLEEADLLMLFGQVRPHTVRVEGHGLRVKIEGQRYTFDTFDANFRKHMHLDWQVVHIPGNTDKVLAISTDGKLRFVLERKHEEAMAIIEQTEADRAYHKRIENFNKERINEVIDTYASDNKLVDQVMSQLPLTVNDHEELMLKGMFTIKGQQKESLQDAKRLGKVHKKAEKAATKAAAKDSDNWQTIQQNYLASKVNYDEYLD